MLKHIIQVAKPQSLLMAVAGVLAASTASVLIGNINVPVTLIFLLCAIFVQLMANLLGNYFVIKRLKPEIIHKSDIYNGHQDQFTTAPDILKAASIICGCIVVTLGMFLVAVGNTSMIIPAILVGIAIYFNTYFNKPLRCTWWGVFLTFLCFGPLEVITCYYVQNFDTNPLIVPFSDYRGLLGLSTLTGLMAVNLLFIYIYTTRELALNTDTPTISRRSQAHRMTWYYFIESAVTVVLGIVLILNSQMLLMKPVMIVLISALGVIYFYIWLKLPGTKSYKDSLNLYQLSLYGEFAFFLITFVIMLCAK